jgi:hypothetical protein
MRFIKLVFLLVNPILIVSMFSLCLFVHHITRLFIILLDFIYLVLFARHDLTFLLDVICIVRAHVSCFTNL